MQFDHCVVILREKNNDIIYNILHISIRKRSAYTYSLRKLRLGGREQENNLENMDLQGI